VAARAAGVINPSIKKDEAKVCEGERRGRERGRRDAVTSSSRATRGLHPTLALTTSISTRTTPQVVDTVSAADIDKQAVYCRCWRSGTFPLCNGAHVAHNKETGDNVGPLIIKKE